MTLSVTHLSSRLALAEQRKSEARLAEYRALVNIQKDLVARIDQISKENMALMDRLESLIDEKSKQDHEQWWKLYKLSDQFEERLKVLEERILDAAVKVEHTKIFIEGTRYKHFLDRLFLLNYCRGPHGANIYFSWSPDWQAVVDYVFRSN